MDVIGDYQLVVKNGTAGMGKSVLPAIDFQDLYYTQPQKRKKAQQSGWVDPELLAWKIGIPAEQKKLSGVAVDAVLTPFLLQLFQEKLLEAGVIFCPISEAI